MLLYWIGVVCGLLAAGAGVITYVLLTPRKRRAPRSVTEWIEKEISTAGVVFAGQPATIALDNGSLKLWNHSDSRVEYWLRITRDPDAEARRREYRARNQDVH